MAESNRPGPQRAPHSAEYFGLERQYWWNPDFLMLMSERWQLDRVTCALDVGCGVGHWTSVLAAYLPAAAELVGVDREEPWLEIARRVASSMAEGSEAPRATSFVRGAAEALPFPDASFDLVTCQTLLIHVADPVAVLTEMRRVLQPGGLLVIVEPNNLVQTMLASTVTAADDVATVLARVRLQLMCERGRTAIGEGDFSVGDRIPGLVSRLGFTDVRTYLSDRALSLLPPYEGDEQCALTAAVTSDAFNADAWVFRRADAERYFLAADGTTEELERLWATVVQTNLREREQVLAGTFDRPGARTMYLVSGRAA